MTDEVERKRTPRRKEESMREKLEKAKGKSKLELATARLNESAGRVCYGGG